MNIQDHCVTELVKYIGSDRLLIEIGSGASKEVHLLLERIALSHLARDLGFQCCAMSGFDAKVVANMINVPEDCAIGPVVVIGKGTDNSWPKTVQRRLDKSVFEVSF